MGHAYNPIDVAYMVRIGRIMAVQSVHGTGVNWELVATLAGVIIPSLTVIFGIFARLVANSITSSIDKFRIEVVSVLDHRLTVVETILKVRKDLD